MIGTAESQNPELTCIARREPGEKGNDNYRKLFFRENKVVGVLMIGSPKGRKKLVEIVKNQQSFLSSADREALLTLK